MNALLLLFDFTWPSWAEWFLIRPKLLSMPYLQAIKYPNMSISIAILFSTPIPSNHSRKLSSHNRITLEHIHCLLFSDFMRLSNKNPEKNECGLFLVLLYLYVWSNLYFVCFSNIDFSPSIIKDANKIIIFARKSM